MSNSREVVKPQAQMVIQHMCHLSVFLVQSAILKHYVCTSHGFSCDKNAIKCLLFVQNKFSRQFELKVHINNFESTFFNQHQKRIILKIIFPINIFK